jgi:cell division protein FtsB
MKRRIARQKTAGRKKFLIFFALLVTAITALAVFGDKGLIDVLGLKKERGELEELESKKASLKGKNEKLAREIELLKNDKRYIAAIARRELGMVGPDEVIYRIEEK